MSSKKLHIVTKSELDVKTCSVNAAYVSSTNVSKMEYQAKQISEEVSHNVSSPKASPKVSMESFKSNQIISIVTSPQHVCFGE